MDLSPQRIARATKTPQDNVEQVWPHVLQSLIELGIGDIDTQIAAAATIGTECPTFLPVKEMGGDEYLSRYDFRKDLGNSVKGDGVRYCGRGLIQITGRANYAYYGEQLGVDLIEHPELALTIEVAAPILAIFFLKNNVAQWAQAENWLKVRKIVNGGTNGLSKFLGQVDFLKKGA